MENQYTQVDGKRIVMLEDNIMIIPDEASRYDKSEIPVFPHSQPADRVREVYMIMTNQNGDNQ